MVMLHIHTALYHLPVDNLPYTFDMLGAAILIVEIIGVLPNIYSEERFHAVAHGIVAIVTAHNVELATLVLGEPHPARTEKCCTSLFHLAFKRLEIAKVEADGT